VLAAPVADLRALSGQFEQMIVRASGAGLERSSGV
jgi:hypothetical protein